MLHTTVEATRAIFKADPSLTPLDRSHLIALLRNHGRTVAKKAEPSHPEPRLIRRAEVARRLGCSLRAVDNWAHAGILRKVTLPGRVRAAGFREGDLVALIEGKCSSIQVGGQSHG